MNFLMQIATVTLVAPFLFGLVDSGLLGKVGNTVKCVLSGPQNVPSPPASSPILTIQDIQRCYNETQLSNNDPDITRNTPELISAHGYAVETHTVTTKDGYILTLFRIPNPKNQSSPDTPRKSVLLGHGLLGSSAQWVNQIGDKNLAMKLVDAGYDVWLSNNRGTSYSTGHVTLTENDAKYWDFSWHEMGVYDVPAMVDYILEKTGNSKLFYVGHSQGTTQLMIALSENESYNDKIEVAFLLAPIGYLSHSTSIFRQLAPLGFNLQYLTDPLLGGKLQADALTKYFGTSVGQICATTTGLLSCPLCGNVLTLVFGYDGPQMDFPRLNVLLSKNPDSASTKCVVHYAQSMSHCPENFRQFDYLTAAENMKRYNKTEPPAYDLSKVTTKVVAFYGDQDNLGNPTDVKITYSKLGPNSQNELIEVLWPDFNHFDFAFAKDADTLVYDHILYVMDQSS